MSWVDGWPIVGDLALAVGTPRWPLHPAAAPPGRDDFDLGEFHPQWVSLRHRPADLYTTKDRDGWLTLHAGPGTLDDLDVTFLGRRQQHFAFRARALIDPAEGRGGLAVRLDEHHHYEIEVAGGRAEVRARIGPLATVAEERAVPEGPVVLRIEGSSAAGGDPRSGPDMLSLGVEEPSGAFSVLVALDGRYLSTEVAGGFTGRVIGMYAAAGIVHFDWFDYEPVAQPL